MIDIFFIKLINVWNLLDVMKKIILMIMVYAMTVQMKKIIEIYIIIKIALKVVQKFMENMMLKKPV